MTPNILSNPDCPCLNGLPAKYQSIFLNGTGTSICDLVSRRQDLFRDSNDLICPLAPDYGLHCKNHNLFATKSCQNPLAQQLPDFCYEKWCYIDPDICFSSNYTMFEDMNAPGFFYSYSTCSDDTFSKISFQEKKENSLDDAVIEMVIPDYVFPYVFKARPEDGYPVSKYTDLQGAFIEYFDDILQRSKIRNVIFKTRSGGSTKKSPNSIYTAAVTDVASDLADIAVGNFWVTSERLLLTTFTTPVHTSPLYLFELKKTDGNDVGFAIRKTLKPFTNELWLALIICVIVAGIMSVCNSNANGHSAWHQTLSGNYPKSSARAKRHRAINGLGVYVDSIIRSFVEYFGASSEQVPESPFSHKVLIFGFGFFILVVSSTYTANLASFLTVPKLGDYIQDMNDAVESNSKICAMNILKEPIESRWEKLKDNSNVIYLHFSGTEYILEASKKLKKGECDVFIGDKAHIDFMEEAKRTELCEKEIVSMKVPVMMMDWALPIQSKYAADFSKIMSDSKTDFQEVLTTYSQSFTCDIYIHKKAAENSRISALQMAFPFLILSIAIFIGILLKLGKSFEFRGNRSPQESADTLFTKPVEDDADIESKQIDTKVVDAHDQKNE